MHDAPLPAAFIEAVLASAVVEEAQGDAGAEEAWDATFSGGVEGSGAAGEEGELVREGLKALALYLEGVLFEGSLSDVCEGEVLSGGGGFFHRRFWGEGGSNYSVRLTVSRAGITSKAACVARASCCPLYPVETRRDSLHE